MNGKQMLVWLPKFSLLSLFLCALGCNPPASATRDLSNFDDFRMDSIYAPQPCACSDGSPVSTHIVRQEDGIFHVAFENSSRDLTPDEVERLAELYKNVEFANTLLACLTRTAVNPDCVFFFYWDSLDGSNSASATNLPCALGADPLTSEQAESIKAFMSNLEAGVLIDSQSL
jgi:hypothetical protein